MRVSGTQRAVEHAGRDDELEYQEMLKGLELKRDMESILVGTNQAKAAGAEGASPRKLASVLSWIKTNTSKSSGGGGADPAAADGTGTRTDGTQRAFKEDQLKTVLQAIWNSGGKPDCIMVGGFNKQAFSTFTGRATPTEDTKAKKIVASVKFYDSDFGVLEVAPNRFMRARDALVLQTERCGRSPISTAARWSRSRSRAPAIPSAGRCCRNTRWWPATRRPPAACST